MLRVQILTPGFTSPNGRAFLFPLLVWRRALACRGIEIRLVRDLAGLDDSDVLVVDSKFHRDRWLSDVDGILAEFAVLRQQTRKLIYCDTTDSSGWLQTELLPLVDRYWKFQLLRDRDAYLRPMYGHRIYTDFYHRTNGVCDDEPVWSAAVTETKLLDKLDAAWNSGLADYSAYGLYRTAAYVRLPISSFLQFPANAFRSPGQPRNNAISCRFGASYSRASVAWQRQTIKARLRECLPTDRLSRRQYFAELRNSQLVLSPFGFGEICYRDFEAFMAGGLLIKPDMSHLETWPNLYRNGETYVAHSWNLEDLETILDDTAARYGELIEVAKTGQECYWRHTAGPLAAELFCDHFEQLLARN